MMYNRKAKKEKNYYMNNKSKNYQNNIKLNKNLLN